MADLALGHGLLDLPAHVRDVAERGDRAGVIAPGEPFVRGLESFEAAHQRVGLDLSRGDRGAGRRQLVAQLLVPQRREVGLDRQAFLLVQGRGGLFERGERLEVCVLGPIPCALEVLGEFLGRRSRAACRSRAGGREVGPDVAVLDGEPGDLAHREQLREHDDGEHRPRQG
ncbi:MAG: hypothetical protein U5R31_02540 [Acidimicrobiia bacterium]|nr:hypothetical protein [Acidimicrobiia bacterium]